LSTATAIGPENDAATGRSAMRKATWHLIPLIGIGYGVAYMDRVNISFASLQMNRDLHFSATVYGLGASLFFLSYAMCEIPSNLLLYRIGARRWLARIMLTWGLLAMAMMFVRTPFQFYAMRFLLGMAEAGFFPGTLYYLTLWFPANLRARSISRFYVALPLSSVVMGAIAGSLFKLDGRFGLAGWQWLFVVEGLPAILLSVVFLKYLPDGPAKARWLSQDERGWMEGRLAAEAAGGVSTNAAAAILDLRVWLFGLTNLLMLAVNYAYAFFAPAMIQRLTGLDVGRVGFIVSIIGVMGGAAMIVNAWHSERYRESYLHIIVPAVFESACLVVIAMSSNPWIALPLLALMFFAHNAIQGPLLALPSRFLKGRSAAAGLATINMIGIIGGVLGPAATGWSRDRTGGYVEAIYGLSLTMLAAAAIVGVLYFNSRKRSLRSVEGVFDVSL